MLLPCEHLPQRGAAVAHAHQEPQHSQKSQKAGRQVVLSTHLGNAAVLWCVTGSRGY